MLDNNLAHLKRKIGRLYIISGCGIVLYTDGIIEQLDDQGERFGFERLRQYFESNPRPAEMIEYVKSVASQTAPQDDMSVLTITFDKENMSNSSKGWLC